MNENEVKQYLIDFQEKELPATIERMISIPHTEKIKVIIGPRRAGKTFLLYQLMKNLKLNKKEILYLNFENTRLIEINFKEIKNIIALNFKLFNSKKKEFALFLDEPQNIDKWEIGVRELFDEGYNIFISGSSSKLLSKEISTSLRGRSISYLLLPFSFEEFLKVKKFEYLEMLSSDKKINLLNLLSEYLEFGGFPEVVLSNNHELKLKNIESYFELTVYKDIIERYKIKDASLIKWFLKSAASRYAKELSINKIYLTLKSQGRKISKDELYFYSSMVEDSMFLFYLPKFSKSIRKKSAINKVYLNDTGFAKLFGYDEEIGKKMENMVFLELVRRKNPLISLFYWKNTQQEEVDFVIVENNKIKQLIQVCKDIYEEKTKQREVRSLLKASKELDCKDLKIITENYESEEDVEWFGIKGRIIFTPVWKWLLEQETI